MKRDAALSPRLLWLAALLAIYLGAFAFGMTSWMIGTQNQDSLVMEKLAETHSNFTLEGSYAVMAFLYAHTSEMQRVAIEMVAGITFIVYCLKPINTGIMLAVVSFIILPPISFFLIIFNKETILVFFVVAAAISLRSPVPIAVRWIVVVLIYATYAIVFRQYYFLIVGVFVALSVARRLPAIAIAAGVAALIGVLMLMPPEVFMKLQSSRDLYNLDRLGRDLPGTRTAFGNIVSPDSVIHFGVNYLYAAIRLNLPFFSGVTVRDIYLFANIMVLSRVVLVGAGDPKSADSTMLFLSHVLVCICFEPDVGSYFRHVSSAIPYLVPALIVMDRRVLARSAARTVQQAA